VLVAKRTLWQQIQTSKPFPGAVEAAIAADTPLAIVRPVLAAVRAAGYPIVDVLEAVPAGHWPSRTLGDVPYVPRPCRLRIEAGRDLPEAGTWGEMARALAR
jgi:hypothetical protein